MHANVAKQNLNVGARDTITANPQGALEVQITMISTLIGELFDVDQRLNNVLDRIFNPRPEEVNKGVAGNPVPQTLEGLLQENSMMLANAVASLRDRVKRLESI